MPKYRIVREVEAKTMTAALRREADGELVECYVYKDPESTTGVTTIGFQAPGSVEEALLHDDD